VETCYRHRDRETGVACANCGRPICPDCMTATPVGIRCPECAGRRMRVRRPGFALERSPNVTYVLLAINIILFPLTNQLGSGLLGGGGFFGSLNELGRRLALFGPAVANGEYERLLTGAFIHFGVLHIGFNMYMLWVLGGVFERYIGPLRFAAIYVVSALAGSFGALLVTPDALTAGASGALFGLMGAMFLLERQRGLSLLGGSIGGLIVINLIFTFSFSGISVGGHVGGLIGGALAGFALSGYGRGHIAYGRPSALALLGVLAIAVGSVAGSLAVVG
jgi:membrane associated rhomboid family serine protease